MDKKIKKFCGEPSEKYWAVLGNVAPSLIQVARFCVVNSMGNVELAIRILTLAGVWSLPTLPKLVGKCDGYWKGDCLQYGKEYNPSAPKGCPQSRISKDQWPTKKIFLHKLKRVETLIRKRGRMMGSNDNYGIKFYKGPAHSRITDEWVGSEELEIRNRAGKIICWPGGFRSHYLETYNVLPSQELYDAVMNFILPYY